MPTTKEYESFYSKLNENWFCFISKHFSLALKYIKIYIYGLYKNIKFIFNK